MAETVFILGAGASQEAGVPLMHQFLDVADRLRKTTQVGQAQGDFGPVLEGIAELQKVHSTATMDLKNIEAHFRPRPAGKAGTRHRNRQKVRSTQ